MELSLNFPFLPEAPLLELLPDQTATSGSQNASEMLLEGLPAGVITKFSYNYSSADPGSLTAGPDGNLWFADYGGDAIGRITPKGVITEFPTPGSSINPTAITAGPDGNLWFTAISQIGNITTKGVVTDFSLNNGYGFPQGITTGPDGNLWFAEYDSFGSAIGRITPKGVITDFPIPNVTYPDGTTWPVNPAEITAGPDGNLWFTSDQSLIGQITTSGDVTEYVPLNSSSFGCCIAPAGISAEPDGNIWFADYGPSKVGYLSLGGNPTPTPTSTPCPSGSAMQGGNFFTPTYPSCTNLWGVDSHSSLIPTRYTKENLYNEVDQPEPQGYGGAPDFWGRFIGYDPTKPDPHSINSKGKPIQYKKDLFPAEATFAHSVGLAILPIYFNFSPSTLVTTRQEGQNYAKWAIEDALGRLGISQGVAIFVDIEPSPVSPTPDFIQGWYNQFNTSFTFTNGNQSFKYNAGYYNVGYYGDSNKTSNTKFDQAYCGAVNGTNKIMAEPQIGTNSFIWAEHPSPGISSKANYPPFAPYKPKCASTTPAWQYGIQPNPPMSPNVDTDEAQQALPLWHP